jgi:hypothetical protein
MDLITLEEYKSFNALSANPKEDVKYSLLISSVSALIQAYLGIDSAEGGKSVTEVISLDYDTNVIYLENYPVESITSITESDRYTYDSTVHVPLVYHSDYILNSAMGTLTRVYRPGGFASWPIGPGVITVTYLTAAKWEGLEVPMDLKLATIELVNYYKNEEFRQSKTMQGSSIVNTIAQGTDFPKHIQVILDRYK